MGEGNSAGGADGDHEYNEKSGQWRKCLHYGRESAGREMTMQPLLMFEG